MLHRRSFRMLAVLGLLILLPTLSEAGVTITNAVPGNMTGSVAQPVKCGASVTRTASDPAFTSGNVSVNVPNNPLSSTINNNTSFQPGSLDAVFTGTITFTPPLPAGTAVHLTFSVDVTGGAPVTTTVNFTVK